MHVSPQPAIRRAVLGNARIDPDTGSPHDTLRRQHGLRERYRASRRAADPRRRQWSPPLGHELMTRRDGPITADILITHTHWDHIQGLPFFKPLSGSGNAFRVFGAAQDGASLEAILRRQMDPMVFPVPLEAFAATIEVREIGEGALELPDFHVTSFRLRHPGMTLGYRVAPVTGGHDLAYVTDNELGAGGTYPVASDWRAMLVRFLNGVDTLVHDTMYSDQIIDARKGWGHSTPRQAVDLAAEANARPSCSSITSPSMMTTRWTPCCETRATTPERQHRASASKPRQKAGHFPCDRAGRGAIRRLGESIG